MLQKMLWDMQLKFEFLSNYYRSMTMTQWDCGKKNLYIYLYCSIIHYPQLSSVIHFH